MFAVVVNAVGYKDLHREIGYVNFGIWSDRCGLGVGKFFLLCVWLLSCCFSCLIGWLFVSLKTDIGFVCLSLKADLFCFTTISVAFLIFLIFVGCAIGCVVAFFGVFHQEKGLIVATCIPIVLMSAIEFTVGLLTEFRLSEYLKHLHKLSQAYHSNL